MGWSDARDSRDRPEGHGTPGGGNGTNGNKNAGSNPGLSGGRGTPSQQQDRRNQEAARAAGNTAPGVKGSSKDFSSTQGMSPTDVARSYTNRERAIADANDTNVPNTFMDSVGKFVGGLFGIGEMNPMSEGVGNFMDDPNAQWGVDPISAAMGLGGFANPALGLLGKGYNVVKGLTGWQGPMIGFGHQHGPGYGGPSYDGSQMAGGAPAGGVNTASAQSGLGMQGPYGGGTGNNGGLFGQVPGHTVTPAGVTNKPTQTAAMPTPNPMANYGSKYLTAGGQGLMNYGLWTPPYQYHA